MHRFFLPVEYMTREIVNFPAALAHQMRHVLRLKEGAEVEVLDDQGNALRVRLEVLSDSNALGKIVERSQPQTEPTVKVALCISLTQREKFELLLQKNVEVGTARILPFVSRYSLVREKNIESKRRQRWQDILREAAEQSGRIVIPTLGEVSTLPKLITRCVAEYDLCLVAWEDEHSTSLQESLQGYKKTGNRPRSVAVFVGPEGGFAQQEMELFGQAEVKAVSLGKRILRMETAAILAPALILYELGQMEV